MNIRVYRANDLLVRMNLVDENKDALKLEGASFLFVAYGPNGKAFEKTSEPGGGITITDQDEGHIAMALTSSDTDINPGQYWCELLLTDVEGARYTAGRGLLTILDSLTAGR